MTTTSKLEQKLVSIVADKNFGMTIYEDGKGAGGHVTIKTSNEGNNSERFGFYLCVWFEAGFSKKDGDTEIDINDIAVDSAELWYAVARDVQKVTYNIGEKDTVLINTAIEQFLQAQLAERLVAKDEAPSPSNNVRIFFDEEKLASHLGYDKFNSEIWVGIGKLPDTLIRFVGTYDRINQLAVYEDGILQTPVNQSFSNIKLTGFRFNSDKDLLTDSSEIDAQVKASGISAEQWTYIKQEMVKEVLSLHKGESFIH